MNRILAFVFCLCTCGCECLHKSPHLLFISKHSTADTSYHFQETSVYWLLQEHRERSNLQLSIASGFGEKLSGNPEAVALSNKVVGRIEKARAFHESEISRLQERVGKGQRLYKYVIETPNKLESGLIILSKDGRVCEKLWVSDILISKALTSGNSRSQMMDNRNKP